ncbi:MAG: lysophospholipid acyltransferase family protein [Myxococcaceae bacterium]
MRRALRYSLLRAVAFPLSYLPLRWVSRLGAWGGRVYGRLAQGERKKALESLAIAFPEKTPQEHEALADACFQHLGRAGGELLRLQRCDGAIEKTVTWDATEQAALKEILGRGGVVLVTAHLGSWEMLGRRIGLTCHPMSAVARVAPDPLTTRWIERVRARANVRTLWRGAEGSARGMLATLRGGGILTMLIDQDTKVQSFFVPFFGRLASTPRAAADLALRTGAAVATGFCFWVAPGRYRLEVREQLVMRTDDAEADAARLTGQLTHAIEAAIRRAPEQWVWMHRRWKTQP